MEANKNPPGRVRDAIFEVLMQSPAAMSISTIASAVEQIIGETPRSSIRSYLRLNTPEYFIREARGIYRARSRSDDALQRKLVGADDRTVQATFRYQKAEIQNADCFDWLQTRRANSIHAVVTDPPYGLHEYAEEQQAKLRKGKGGSGGFRRLSMVIGDLLYRGSRR